MEALALDTEAVLDRLLDAGVSVWLDADGRLRIDKGAPEDIKQLVCEHKSELIEVRKAHSFLNQAAVRIVRLPLGEFALAYPPRINLDQLRWAAQTLHMDSMPLVINDEGLEWITPKEWRRRQVARLFAEHRREWLKHQGKSAPRLPLNGPRTRETGEQS
jgi:hypothetical protein